MKAGDVVTIYEDPITETKPEGKARLIKRHSVGLGGLERWAVRFIDGFKADRCIKAKAVAA